MDKINSTNFTINDFIGDYSLRNFEVLNSPLNLQHLISLKDNQDSGNRYTSLSQNDMQNIINTRIIVSAIGSVFCLICIIVYLLTFYKIRCRKTNNKGNSKIKDFEKLIPIDNNLNEDLLFEKGHNFILNKCEDQNMNSNNYKENENVDFNNTENHIRNTEPEFNYNINCDEKFNNEIKTSIILENIHQKNIKNPLKPSDEISKITSISTFDFKGKPTKTFNGENSNYDKIHNLNNENLMSKISEQFVKVKINKESNEKILQSNIKENMLNYYSIYVEKNNFSFIKEEIGKKRYSEKYDLIHIDKDNNNIIFENRFLKNQKKHFENNSRDNFISKSLNNGYINNQIEDYNPRNNSNTSLFFSNVNDLCDNNPDISNRIIENRILKIKSKSLSDTNSIFNYKDNVFNLNGNHPKNNYFLNSANKNTIITRSDSEEFNKLNNINNLSDNNYLDDSFSKNSSINSFSNEKNPNLKPKELKMGMINDILFMLIITNLGYIVCSFLVPDVINLVKINKVCQLQGLLQNFFDFASICWTTVISALMKNLTNEKINLENEKKKFKWYVIYCLLFPACLTLG